MSDIRFSRPLAAAARLGNQAAERHLFLNKRVLVTGEPDVLSTPNGRTCLLYSLRLLIRLCRDVSVVLPTQLVELHNVCHQTLDPLVFGGAISYLSTVEDYAQFDAVLSVGAVAKPELPWTVVNSNGWLARVSSGASSLPAECAQTNPIGALAAACLGSADIFKRLVRLRSDRGRVLDGLSFSLHTYQVDDDPGPPLPQRLTTNLLLVGAGAIGNGVALLLQALPIVGHITIVDVQEYGPENLATCVMIGPQHVGLPKAHVLANSFPANIAQPYSESLNVFTRRLAREVPFPAVILGAVDNIDARHEIQRQYADLTIDGAIGDFGCQVSRHGWDGDDACLMCLFQHPTTELAEQVGSRLTGIPVSRILNSLSPVTEEDILAAPEEKRTDLRPWLGRKICAVVSHMLVQHLSQDRQRDRFEPSVPFTACFSASMIVAEMVKALTMAPTHLKTRFQLDMLRGPAYGQMLPQARRDDCLCVTRRHNIEKIRKNRARSLPLPR